MDAATILEIISAAIGLAQVGTQTIQQLQADGATQTTAEQTAAFQAAHANYLAATAAWQAAGLPPTESGPTIPPTPAK